MPRQPRPPPPPHPHPPRPPPPPLQHQPPPPLQQQPPPPLRQPPRPPQQQPPQQDPNPPQPQQQQPPQQPPQPYPPYHPYHHYYPPPKPSSSSSPFLSCCLATFFLITLTLAATITLFILFRPLDPHILLTSINFPTFSISNSSLFFTLSQHFSLHNPNKFLFSHYDSSLQLLSDSTGPIGLVYIPAGNIPSGSTQFLTATFDVRSFPAPPQMADVTMELVSKMKLVGTVKVFKVFSHHVEKSATCRVTVRVGDGSVLGYHC